MNKKLIALAVAGAIAAPLAAQAQSSNVTIYGTIRMGIAFDKASGATAGAAANTRSRMRVIDNASNLGFKGEEDLGNGLKAFWQIENAIVPDGQNNTGVAAGQGWAVRNTGMGLKGSWGEFMLGRWDIYYTNHVLTELFVVKTLASSWSLALFGNLNGTYYGGGRFPNVVMYTTPNWNGFTGRVQYSTGVATELKVNGGANDGADERTWALSGTYLNGPLFVNYSYFSRKDIGNVKGYNTRFDKLSGSYLFGGTTRLGLAWERGRVDQELGVAGANGRRSAWLLALSHQMGKHGVHGEYARANDYNGGALNTGTATGAHFFSLSYTYDLSKRTNLFATYAKVSNKNNAQYDFFINSGVGGAAGGAVAAGADPVSYSFGMVHSF